MRFFENYANFDFFSGLVIVYRASYDI